MKRTWVLLTLPVLTASLTGCGVFSSFMKNLAEKTLETASEAGYEVSEPDSESSYNESDAGTQECTVGNISFEVPGNWEPIDGFEGSFTSPDQKTAYQLQGESMLGSYTPQEFFEELAGTYSSSYEVTYKDEDVTPFTTADGTECFVGRIKMTSNKVLFNIDVLAAPDKNTVLTFASQCPEDREPSSDIRDVTRTVVFNIGTEDMASGRNFTVSTGTEIHLNQDGSFIYYAESDNPDSSFYEGTYEVFYGQPAFDKLVSMTEYGLTEEELEQTLSANMNGYSVGGSMPYDYFDDGSSYEEGYRICKDTFYAIIMHTTKLNENGETSDIDGTALYMGYYVPELEIFDLLSVNTYTYTQWTEIG